MYCLPVWLWFARYIENYNLFGKYLAQCPPPSKESSPFIWQYWTNSAFLHLFEMPPFIYIISIHIIRCISRHPTSFLSLVTLILLIPGWDDYHKNVSLTFFQEQLFSWLLLLLGTKSQQNSTSIFIPLK